MLHIAICDDEAEAVRFHAEITESCLQQCKISGEIAAYTTSDNLLYDISEVSRFALAACEVLTSRVCLAMVTASEAYMMLR